MTTERTAEAAVVLSTAPPDRAAGLARVLVEERLAACVNVIAGVRSLYRWEGEVCDDEESLLVIKARWTRVDELTARLIELHPYSVPEVIALPIAGGNPGYLEWLLRAAPPAAGEEER